MLTKNILAAFALAGLAIAIPVEDLQERATCPSGQDWCCATAFPLNIFFIQGVGSNCVAKPSAGCKAPKAQSLCCANHQIADPSNGNVVCTA
ncbi:hypothetical protein N7523_007245 [Penicillium sp. IBT 18751x]|nr:hypothetical protein N7523_007245 [Penicillium sp. IBT 18751x]